MFASITTRYKQHIKQSGGYFRYRKKLFCQAYNVHNLMAIKINIGESF